LWPGSFIATAHTFPKLGLQVRLRHGGERADPREFGGHRLLALSNERCRENAPTHDGDERAPVHQASLTK
jgi:hypothetical protein